MPHQGGRHPSAPAATRSECVMNAFTRGQGVEDIRELIDEIRALRAELARRPRTATDFLTDT